MDRVTPEKRSQIMSRIRGKNTTPELIVRQLIYSLGYRYRIHSKKLPGRPDIVFHGRKKIIFVHGCFWHGHEGCNKGRPPKSNIHYWVTKLENNRKRDLEKQSELIKLGWKVLVIWQCELKNMELLRIRIIEFLN